MIALFSVLLLVTATTDASKSCQTPYHKPGQCVLINHCPVLFNLLQNYTTQSINYIRQFHCGLHASFFPKVCCPNAVVKFHTSRFAPKCGWHTPEGDSDPWMVLIEYQKPDGKREVLCGGVLVHKKYVLTAAHCVESSKLPKNARMINVRFGDYRVFQIEDSVVHEGYNPDDPNQANNIALIRLKKKVVFGDDLVQPICLPGSGQNHTGVSLQLAGWEKSGNASDNFVKRAGIATVWENSECESIRNDTKIVLKDNQMCAGGKKNFVDSFDVDVGGLLMEVSPDNIYSLVGILSLKPPCCDKVNHPKVYTKVSSYFNWIINNMDF